jgi:hypothetical protein
MRMGRLILSALLMASLATLAAGCGVSTTPTHAATGPKPIPSDSVSVPGYGFRFQVPKGWSASSATGGKVLWVSPHRHMSVEAWGTRSAEWVTAASLVKHQTALGLPARKSVEAFAEARMQGWTRIEESWTSRLRDYLLIAYVNGKVADLALFQYSAADVARGIQVVANAAATFRPSP